MVKAAVLYEANKPDTFKPPTDYKIEFAKKVSDVNSKEIQIHYFLMNF